MPERDDSANHRTSEMKGSKVGACVYTQTDVTPMDDSVIARVNFSSDAAGMRTRRPRKRLAYELIQD